MIWSRFIFWLILVLWIKQTTCGGDEKHTKLSRSHDGEIFESYALLDLEPNAPYKKIMEKVDTLTRNLNPESVEYLEIRRDPKARENYDKDHGFGPTPAFDLDLEDRRFVAIDFGTTFSKLAIVENGKVELIQNQFQSTATPTVVCLSTKGSFLVGETCYRRGSRRNMVKFVKRALGNSYDEVSRDKAVMEQNTIVKGPNGNPLFSLYLNDEIQYNVTAERITSYVLLALKRLAEKRVGSKIRRAVLSIPAVFRQSQMEALKRAASYAQFDVIHFIREPNAAVVAYMFNQKPDGMKPEEIRCECVLGVDCGGGTTDFSIVDFCIRKKKDEKGFQMSFDPIGTMGNSSLGGIDFTRNLFVDNRRRYQEKFNVERLSDEDYNTIMEVSEKEKFDLSIKPNDWDEDTEAWVDFRGSKGRIQYAVTQDQFHEMSKVQLDEFSRLQRELFLKKRANKTKITAAILVGGGSNIPWIWEAVEKNFRCDEKTDENCNKVVKILEGVNKQDAIVLGAGYWGEFGEDLKITDRLAYSLGIAVVSLHNTTENRAKLDDLPEEQKILIAKEAVEKDTEYYYDGDEFNFITNIAKEGQILPYKNNITFYTVVDNQTSLRFRVFEGESCLSIGPDMQLLDTFTVSVQPAPKGKETVEVSINVDKDGHVSILAFYEKDGTKISRTIKSEKLRKYAKTHLKAYPRF